MKPIDKRYLWISVLSLFAVSVFVFFVPLIGFDSPFSTVVYDREGGLLGARISSDGQWRFPGSDHVPERFEQSLLTYEDKRFYLHRGIDPVSLIRAISLNLKYGEIRSGGSTLTMQLARMYGENHERTIWNKCKEIILALRLELSADKFTILSLYAANAPFGGNIIGLETAAWRYFGKSPEDLTWSESATLAVLPNAPGLIHPGRNPDALLARRDRLLERLYKENYIDSITLDLSLLEPLPSAPLPLPVEAYHLTDFITAKTPGQAIRTTVDPSIQKRTGRILERYQKKYRQNGINNIAVLVVENETGQVLAYHGNAGEPSETPNFYVDMIQSGRPGGSVLKPILYAKALEEGIITECQLLPDIPGRISGFRPRNFNRGFEGAVPANRALARSLNIPAVYLLRDYSLDKFYFELKSLGFSGLIHPVSHYGLPIILGGFDVSLWELAGVYASMARVLSHYSVRSGKYSDEDYFMPQLQVAKEGGMLENFDPHGGDQSLFSAGSVWQCFNAMQQVERPDAQGRWERYANPVRVAWKTGTSYGYRDAWSVGITPRYTLAVWVGNATGEGRPDLTGIQAAAPVLFDVLSLLPSGEWFAEPSDDLEYRIICRETGFPISPFCPDPDTILIPDGAQLSTLCPYHKQIRLDPASRYRLTPGCHIPEEGIAVTRFVLPPLMEYYYARSHPEYQGLPPVHPDCLAGSGETLMAFIYPVERSGLLIPVEYTGEKGRVVFRLAHREPGNRVFWYIDDEMVGTTREFHELEVWKEPGSYLLMAVDESGQKISQWFDVAEK